MPDNWESFIEDFFAQNNCKGVTKQELKNGFYLTLAAKGIYIAFELDLSKEKIIKLEFGSYRQETHEKLPVACNYIKGVLDKTKPYHVAFLQTSYFGEYGEPYELIFDEPNQKLVAAFLKIPCMYGWTEEHYRYKDEDYKAKVILTLENGMNLQFEILLMNFAEQDIPLFGDDLIRKITKSVYDLHFNRRNRTVHVEKRTGLLNKISTT
jgi:hypothetical protein